MLPPLEQNPEINPMGRGGLCADTCTFSANLNFFLCQNISAQMAVINVKFECNAIRDPDSEN